MEDISKIENHFIARVSEQTEDKKINTISEENTNIALGLNYMKRKYLKSKDLSNMNSLLYNNNINLKLFNDCIQSHNESFDSP